MLPRRSSLEPSLHSDPLPARCVGLRRGDIVQVRLAGQHSISELQRSGGALSGPPPPSSLRGAIPECDSEDIPHIDKHLPHGVDGEQHEYGDVETHAMDSDDGEMDLSVPGDGLVVEAHDTDGALAELPFGIPNDEAMDTLHNLKFKSYRFITAKVNAATVNNDIACRACGAPARPDGVCEECMLAHAFMEWMDNVPDDVSDEPAGDSEDLDTADVKQKAGNDAPWMMMEACKERTVVSEAVPALPDHRAREPLILSRPVGADKLAACSRSGTSSETAGPF